MSYFDKFGNVVKVGDCVTIEWARNYYWTGPVKYRTINFRVENEFLIDLGDGDKWDLGYIQRCVKKKDQ